MPFSVMNAEQRMSEVALLNSNLTTPVATASSWLEDQDKVDKVKSLKDIALGNCRLLYGSERFKFYDIVICSDEANRTFSAILTCNQDGHSKLMRKSLSNCPVKAVCAMVDRLQKDTSLLFVKYDVGSQLDGQQGYMNTETGNWDLSNVTMDMRRGGPDDDTAGLVKAGGFGLKRGGDSWIAPRGARGDRESYKKPRIAVDGSGILNYED